jgi:DNA repair protein RadC
MRRAGSFYKVYMKHKILDSPTLLPMEYRPRERLCENGCESLSDRELLAILLNSGIKGKNVMNIASDLLLKIESKNIIPSVEEISNITGIGVSKACAVVAMLEFGRRRWGPHGIRISVPSKIFSVIRHYADYPQERFIVMSLNGAHELIATRIVTIGLANKTIVHPREVFSDVIRDRASAICVAHNHPSGKLEPSEDDDDVTIRLKKAADLLGIQFLDHVIFTCEDFYSYRLAGKII